MFGRVNCLFILGLNAGACFFGCKRAQKAGERVGGLGS